MSNSSGCSASATVNIVVEDTTPPVITLNGTDPLTVVCGSDFADPGASAMDDCAGDLTASVQVTGMVDVHTPGSYLLTYQVSDPSGNAAAPVSRTVNVVDTTAPVITLNGSANLTLECGIDSYTEEGATATDNCDPDVTVVVGGDTVDTSTLGTYVVTYDATDVGGNVAAQVTRTVVVQDTTAPVITLIGEANFVVECGVETYIESGAFVTDACDPAVTVMIGGDPVDPSSLGTYVVTYDATDASGNQAAQVIRTVTVQDTIAPAITIIAPSSGHLTQVGASISFSADIDEACGLDTAEWHIRDIENQVEVFQSTVSNQTGSAYMIEDTFVFDDAGIYSLTLVATDHGGNQSEVSVVTDNQIEVSVVTDENNEELPAFVVIYDPEGGFVTGGGWLWSPEGAFLPGNQEFADLTGKATFGFVSKYKKGTNVPSGTTEFTFHAGDLNFESTAYEWLVVAGRNAKYKGSGTINGEGDYGFMLTANDGDLQGGDGSDRLRMKIWEVSSGAVIYDNQADAWEDAELGDTTLIQGGQIKLQKQ